MSGWDSQKYGDRAENVFEGLALQYFLVTRPSRDLDGWDFLLRLQNPSRSQGFHAHMRETPPFRYWVQVKSVLAKSTVSKKPKRISLPFTRIINAAKDDCPWFYFVVRHSENWDPVEIFVIHIDDLWIRRISQRLCENPAADPSNMTFDISLNPKDQIDPANAAELLSRITSIHGTTSREYAELKRSWWERAGLEATRSVIKFVTPPGEVGDKLVSEFLLGRGSIPGAVLRQVETRFGIDHEEILSSNGTLTSQPDAIVPITFSTDTEQPESLTLPAGKLFTTAPAQHLLPNTPFAIRIDADIVDITITPKESKGAIVLVTDDKTGMACIRRLASGAKFLRLFENAYQHGHPVNLHIPALPGRTTRSINLPFAPDSIPEISEQDWSLLQAGVALSAFAKAHDADDNLTCNQAQLLTSSQSIWTAYMFFDPIKSNPRFTFSTEHPLATDICILPISAAFSISNRCGYVAGYIQCGWRIIAPGQFEIVNPKPIRIRSEFGASDIVTEAKLRSAIASMKQAVEVLTNITVLNEPSLVQHSFQAALS